MKTVHSRSVPSVGRTFGIKLLRINHERVRMNCISLFDGMNFAEQKGLMLSKSQQRCVLQFSANSGLDDGDNF